MDAGKPLPAKLHMLCTLTGGPDETGMDDVQLVPDSSFGSFSSENDDFFAEYSVKGSLHRSPKAPKKMSRYFKQKLKKTPNTLKRMTEQHRINERRRHNSLNSSIESLARLIPGHFNSQDTKVSILQKLLAYICFLEQKVLHYSKALGIEPQYKRRYLSDYMVTMKALDDLPDDEPQPGLGASTALMRQDAEDDLSNMNEDSLASYVGPSEEAAKATLILVENGYFSVGSNQASIEYFHGDELMDTKYELVYADAAAGKTDVSNVTNEEGQMHMEVVKHDGDSYGFGNPLSATFDLIHAVKQEPLSGRAAELDLGTASGAQVNTSSVLRAVPDSTAISEEKPVLVLRDGRCPSWMNGLMMFTQMRRSDLINVNPGVHTMDMNRLMGKEWRCLGPKEIGEHENPASGYSGGVKQPQANENAVLWSFED